MQVFVSVSVPSNLGAVLSLSTSFGGAVSNVESSGVMGKSEPVTPDQFGVLLFTQLFHTPRRDPPVSREDMGAHYKCVCLGFNVMRIKILKFLMSGGIAFSAISDVRPVYPTYTYHTK